MEAIIFSDVEQLLINLESIGMAGNPEESGTNRLLTGQEQIPAPNGIIGQAG